jgi:hypothetical protein
VDGSASRPYREEFYLTSLLKFRFHKGMKLAPSSGGIHMAALWRFHRNHFRKTV